MAAAPPGERTGQGGAHDLGRRSFHGVRLDDDRRTSNPIRRDREIVTRWCAQIDERSRHLALRPRHPAIGTDGERSGHGADDAPDRSSVLPARLDRVLLEVCVVEAGLAQRAEQQIRGRPGLGTPRHAATDRVGQPLKKGIGSAARHRHPHDAVDAFVGLRGRLRQRARLLFR